MKIKRVFFVIIVLFMGCALSYEEREMRQFLSLWNDVHPFYTNKVGFIASTGFFNPGIISTLHQDLRTNEVFVAMVTQKFSSLEEYIVTFSNITLHYAYLSFYESLSGRSPDVLVREIDDIIKQLETKANVPEKEKKIQNALLLQKRLREYQALQGQISSRWVKLVYRYAEDLGKVYKSLIQ
ncbi:MAG: hypothetical protein ACK4HQ_01710 [Brevinematales bacterium]